MTAEYFYFELVQDVINPRADRRQRYDWTALAVFPKGSRFRLRAGEDGKADMSDRLRCAGTVDGRRSGFPDPFIDALVKEYLKPVEPTDREWVEERTILVEDVFYRLMEQGTVTRAQVEAIDAELTAEGKYK